MNSNSPRGELAASIATAPDASFEVTRDDSAVVRSIVSRAFRDDVLRPCLHFIEDPADARLTLTMDIEAVHANGNPLNLPKLLDSDDFTFRHDIAGIQKNVDRRSGRLRNFFTPRTSLSDGERARLAENVGHLIAAAEHAGAARAHIQHAKAAEEKVDLGRRPAAKRSRKPATAKRSPAAKKPASATTGRKSAPPATRRNPRSR